MNHQKSVVKNNLTQTSPSEESWAFRSVSIQVELAAIEPRQQDSQVVLSQEIDTELLSSEKLYTIGGAS
jgi:hypothetical protein